MSWTCPHQLKDLFCSLRKKECKPGDDGCVLEKKFEFIDPDAEVTPEAEQDASSAGKRSIEER